MMPLLTILITTFNRATVLDVLLELLRSYQQRGLDFKVLVSDDCSSDNTEEICSKWRPKMQGLSYIRTNSNSGMDNNFKNAYENFDTEYCWLLGDTRHISYEGLRSILEILSEKKYDALILRCRTEMPQKRIVYSDISTLMNEQGWHITNNASCVIPQKFINQVLYHRHMGTTFLHMGIFVENLCQMENFKVLYMGDVYITELDVPQFNKVGWTKHPFLNFGKLWYSFIMSLPNQIDIDLKHKVLLDHNKYTKIFTPQKMPRFLFHYGETYRNSYIQNRRFMQYVSTCPLFIYDIIVKYIPLQLYHYLASIYFVFKKRK